MLSRLFSRGLHASRVASLVNAGTITSTRAYSQDPSIFASEIWHVGGQRKLEFMSPAVYAYYWQILHDLQTYFNLSSADASTKILDWKYLDTKNEDLLPMLREESPYYYAAQLVYGPVEPQTWHLRTARPKDYQYCDTYKKLMRRVIDSSTEKRMEAFNDAVKKMKKYQELDGYVFHGTLDDYLESLKRGIDLSVGRAEPTDFNSKDSKVFYVTGALDQARLWARNRAFLRGGAPVVIKYEFNHTLNALKSKYSWLILDNYDKWAEFVTACRKGEKEHSYDAVEGPVLMNPDETLSGEEEPKADGHQIALCSEDLANELKYVTVDIIGDTE